MLATRSSKSDRYEGRINMCKSVAGRIAVLIAMLFFLGGVSEVLARKVEDIFAGKVLLLKKRPPTYFKSKGGFVSYLRSNSVRTVYADKDNTWKFETMAFFRRSLGDYEVEMVFYDIKNGKSDSRRRFVDSYTQYTQDRNTRILSGKANLTRPSFDANKSYMLVVQSHGKDLAKGFFNTKGVTQAALDQQKRVDYEMKEMEKSMADLQKKVKEQEEAEAKKNAEKDKAAADDLF